MTTPPRKTAPVVRWTPEQIRAARHALLAPLLVKRGIALVERPADNAELPAFPGLIVKESYWRWPERGMAGNSIDFLVKVLGLSFADAMREITTHAAAEAIPP